MTFEQIEKINEKLKGMDGKDVQKSMKGYVQVNERIKGFRELCPNGRIETVIVSMENGICTMKAYIYDEEGRLLSTGFAQEKEGSTFVNKTSYIENCETSAIGRALAWLAIGVDKSIASAEEVANAIINQNKTPEQVAKDAYPPREEMLKVIREKNKGDTENMSKILTYYKVTDLDQLKDEQVKAVYNKAMKK